jgi:Zn-dependent peptidase ImmA (M78 family)
VLLGAGPDPVADALYARLRADLRVEGAERAVSIASSAEWIEGSVAAGFPAADHDALRRSLGSPDWGEQAAEEMIQTRLEDWLEDLLPALKSVAGRTGEGLEIRVRPLRSGLHAAFTLNLPGGALIVVDDATHDLTYSLIRLMLGTWAEPRGAGDPEGEHRGAVVRMPEAVRVARAELGSARWNGSLWQPVRVELHEGSWRLASLVANLASQFILAHEVGHAILHRDQPSDPAAAPSAHAGDEREHAADVFALRTLLARLAHDGIDADPEARALVAVAARSALEVIGLITETYMVAAAGHPDVERRFEVAIERCGLEQGAPLEAVADHFFGAMRNMATSHQRPLRTVVEQADGLSFALAYEEDQLEELERLDRIEGLLASSLPSLLKALGEAALADRAEPPPPVLAAAARADQLSRAEGNAGVATSDWILFAAGQVWLFDLLESLGPEESQATLSPSPGTRFCDWAHDAEAQAPEPLRAIVLATLLIFVSDGTEAAGPALKRSGLLEATEDANRAHEKERERRDSNPRPPA